MDIRKIEYFMKVADTLNFSRAAAELHISHQALSKQIQQLEAEIGARLLERTTTKVSLTEVGQKMYDIFLPIIRDVNQGYAKLQEFITYKKDTLRIGYFSTLSYGRVIEPVIGFMQEHAPQIRIDILATDIGLERQLLHQDSIDMAISLLFDEEEWKEYPYVVLRKEKLQIIVSDHHPWYEKNTITISDIEKGSMLVYENRPDKGDKAFFHGMTVIERVHVRNADSYMNTLRQGKHFGIIGENYSRREGNFKLFDLPEGYQMDVPVIAAFKRLHPRVEIMKKLNQIVF